MTFYNASFGNPSENCGELLATTVDKQGILRLTSEGDQDLFRIAGMPLVEPIFLLGGEDLSTGSAASTWQVGEIW